MEKCKDNNTTYARGGNLFCVLGYIRLKISENMKNKHDENFIKLVRKSMVGFVSNLFHVKYKYFELFLNFFFLGEGAEFSKNFLY